jgi:DNA (cytosine-5)-methyltransferase 1
MNSYPLTVQKRKKKTSLQKSDFNLGPIPPPDRFDVEWTAGKINGYKHNDYELAALTHYIQNHNHSSGINFRNDALNAVSNKLKYYQQGADVNLEVAEAALQQLLFEFERNEIPFPEPINPKFTFIDLFAGIGGFRIAFQNLGGKCVFSSEWDKFSQKTYFTNYGEYPFGDITKISEEYIPSHDLLLAGFPCQPFSIAGVSKKNALGRSHGFLDKTQGTLFFDIARILKHRKPQAFMLENVKNLVSHDKGKTFKIILSTLEELGYNVHYKVLDGKHFVPQHRERIFIVGFNSEIFGGKEEFKFPELPLADFKIKDILESYPPEKYTLTDKLWDYLRAYAQKHKLKGNGFGFGLTDLNGISRTISARYYKDGSEILIPQKEKNPRRLTPRECARLQGYPDKFIIPVSDNQAYRQFGNSVTVPLIEFIGEKITQIISTNVYYPKQSN